MRTYSSVCRRTWGREQGRGTGEGGGRRLYKRRAGGFPRIQRCLAAMTALPTTGKKTDGEGDASGCQRATAGQNPVGRNDRRAGSVISHDRCTRMARRITRAINGSRPIWETTCPQMRR